MLFRKLHYLFYLLIIAALTTCYSVRNHTSDSFIEPKVVFPTLQVDLPGSLFDFYLPHVALAEMEKDLLLPFVEITEDFCAFDVNHVASKDPKLFADNDMLLIDLYKLQKQNHSFPLPGAKVISPYAGRRKNHSGTDLKTFAKDTIRAAFDGIVRMAKEYAAYGNVIVVRHFNGLETVYSHNFKHLIKQGDHVVAGQPIALVGHTGRATTDHLHFETRINGQHFNPELLFNMETQQLNDKALLCVKNNGKIKVSTVDPFPYQKFLYQHASN